MGELEARLGPADRVIPAEGGGTAEMYNLGARQARAPWLFFTESHAIGEARCLEEIFGYVTDHDVDGAYCRSLEWPGNWFSGFEQRLFEEDLQHKRTRPNLVMVRGCLLPRETFAEAGGFRAEFGHFSELLLGRTLDRAGMRMGFAERAVVHHANMDRTREVVANIRSTGATSVPTRPRPGPTRPSHVPSGTSRVPTLRSVPGFVSVPWPDEAPRSRSTDLRARRPS